MNIVMRRTGDPVAQAAELDEITATVIDARNAGESYDDWQPVLDDLKACRIALGWSQATEQALSRRAGTGIGFKVRPDDTPSAS